MIPMAAGEQSWRTLDHRLQNVSTTSVESGVLAWTAVNETERRNHL